MGRDGYSGIKTFASKAELDAYLDAEKKYNETRLEDQARYYRESVKYPSRQDDGDDSDDSEDSSREFLDAFYSFAVYPESDRVFDTLRDAETALERIANQRLGDDSSKVIVTARYVPSEDDKGKQKNPISLVEDDRTKRVKLEPRWVAVFSSISGHY